MPSLSNFLNYVKTEAANAIWILLAGFAVYFLWKQEWGKMVMFVVAAGVAAFIINNPDAVSNGLSKVAEMLF